MEEEIHWDTEEDDEDSEDEMALFLYRFAPRPRQAYNFEEDSVSESEIDTEDEEMHDEEGNPLSKRLCAKHARAEYGLFPRDLKTLKCKLRRNPHYRSGPPMRLYLRKEVIDLAHTSDLRREEERSTKRKKTEAALVKRKADADKAVEFAKETVEEFRPFSNTPANSGLSLAWPVILPRLVNEIMQGFVSQREHEHELDLEPGEVHAVMKQLTSLAFTCLEMSQLVVDIAVPILNDRVGVGAWESWGVLSEMSPGWSMYPFWKGITSNPQAVTLDSYKLACRQLGMCCSGRKAEFIIRIYHFLRLHALCPKKTPPEILFALRSAVREKERKIPELQFRADTAYRFNENPDVRLERLKRARSGTA